MHKAVLASTLILLPLLVVAAAVAQPPAKIPGASGTVFAVERFDFGQNTLAAFDASTGEVLNVAPIGKRPIGVTVHRERARSTRPTNGRTSSLSSTRTRSSRWE